MQHAQAELLLLLHSIKKTRQRALRFKTVLQQIVKVLVLLQVLLL
jgi:hypothetical protein